LKVDNYSASQEIPSLLWNAKVSLLCSPEPATGLYPEPYEPSPHPTTVYP